MRADLRLPFFTKATNEGRCLIAEGECPAAYKRSVIRSYVNRAFTHCSTWPLLHQELQRLQQILVNNGFSNKDVQSVIQQKMDAYLNGDNLRTEKRPLILLHYRSFMSTAYRTDERILREIIERGTRPTDPEDKLELRIFYKNFKSSNLILINNPLRVSHPLKRSKVATNSSAHTKTVSFVLLPK